MSQTLRFLSEVAPWVWTAAAISGSLISTRAWWLVRLYARSKKAPGLLAPFISKQATLRVMRCLGYTIVGATSIATSYVYPSAPRPELPFLIELSSLFTLVILLAVPITDAVAGYWTLRFMLDEHE